MIRLKTILKYAVHPKALKREVKIGVRKALRVVGSYWHRIFLPLHFEHNAPYRYPGAYKIRTRATREKKGHSRPMDYTGRMPSLATGFAMIRASTTRVRVNLIGLRSMQLPGPPLQRLCVVAYGPRLARAHALGGHVALRVGHVACAHGQSLDAHLALAPRGAPHRLQRQSV